MQHMLSLIHLGPRDFLVVAQSTAYTLKEMRESLPAYAVKIDEASIEAPGKIGTGERYHVPLRLA